MLHAGAAQRVGAVELNWISWSFGGAHLVRVKVPDEGVKQPGERHAQRLHAQLVQMERQCGFQLVQ
jgi:hypothetical protein